MMNKTTTGKYMRELLQISSLELSSNMRIVSWIMVKQLQRQN